MENRPGLLDSGIFRHIRYAAFGPIYPG